MSGYCLANGCHSPPGSPDAKLLAQVSTLPTSSPLPQAADRAKLPDWQQRVFDEHAELAERASKLAIFLKCTAFDALERRDRQLLSEQLHHMRAYLEVLTQRISRWFP